MTLEKGKFPNIIKPDHPDFLVAEARAKSLAEKASINEAIRVITDLEEEVKTMHIASRFSTTKKPNFDVVMGHTSPLLMDLPEAEYKRQTLLIELGRLKNEIITVTQKIESVVMDIEATKTED